MQKSMLRIDFSERLGSHDGSDKVKLGDIKQSQYGIGLKLLT